MEKLDLNSFTKEQIEKAMECKTPEELIELAKKAGIEITKEQAEAYLEELQDVELDQETLDKVAGGKTHRSHDCPSLSKSDY
jgi:ribosomal protein L12E/L44/L45/RPP1/RPP2